MNKARLEQIKEKIEWDIMVARRILEGDSDGYDGADGARKVRDLCLYCDELIIALEQHLTKID